MYPCTNSFPHRTSFFYLSLFAVVAMASLGTHAQTRSGDGSFQEISFNAAKPCAVQPAGEVTWLVKNGVELSVTEDWDCDGIADAYDNCVGMANPTQVDSDGNWIGDACEAATIIRTGIAAKRRSNVKAKGPNAKVERPKAKAVEKRSRSIAKTRRRRPERSKRAEAKNRKPAEARVRDRKPSAKRKSKT